MLKTCFAFIVALLLFFATPAAHAQPGISPEALDELHAMEDSMMITADSMYHAFIPDTHEAYSQRFIRQLVKALKLPNSYLYPFDKVKKVINIIYADDNAFRIFNWVIATTPVTQRYFGAIQMPGEQLKLYPLIDNSENLGKYAQDSILSNTRWFGALYYRIIAHVVNGQNVYTLFGLNASSPISNKKVLDPLTFTSDGVVFGAPIFNLGPHDAGYLPGRQVNRFILEYSKEVQVSMNWDSSLHVVFFDRLVSQTNDPNRKYTYVPSGEYDGFKWEDDRWNYVENLLPVQNLKDGEAPQGDKPIDKY